MKTNRNEEYTSGDHAVLCCRCELTALVKIGIKIQILCLNNTSNELFCLDVFATKVSRKSAPMIGTYHIHSETGLLTQ